MSDQDTVNVLNELILAAQDEEKGFAEAAGLAEDLKLRLLFKDCARKCRDATMELQAQVMALGEGPEHRGSIAGLAHRGWTELKAAASGHTDIAVLEELERGESRAQAAYVRALQARLPSGVMKLLQQQFDAVSGMLERIQELRHQYRALA
jgi:uncharacterized protein (TIGR02284 family)